MNEYVRMVDRIERAEEIQRYTENRCDTLEKENAELKKRIDNLYNSDCWASDQLTKAKEMLQTILDKWKEERWILQSEKEVKQIENLMKQVEQFIKEIEK